MKHFFSIFSISFLLSSTLADVDLTCPQGTITKDSPTGNFPSVGNVTFPANYECGIQFVIPTGWAVRFVVETNVAIDSNDSFIIQDAANVLNQFSAGATAFFAPANSSVVVITTKSNTASFYFSWEFMNMGLYSKKQNPVGTVLQLNLLPLNYYVFTSDTGPVTLHTANLDRNTDLTTSTVYVYDGDSLNAPYMGNLLQFVNGGMVSSGKALTLVNYYKYNTSSYVIANNYNDISAYSAYNFLLLTVANGLQGSITTRAGVVSAHTFYCIDSTETYITSLTLEDNGWDKQLVQFQPLTPSDKKAPLLSYNAKGDFLNQVPQQIATNLFTMTVTNLKLNVHFDSNAKYTWLIPYPGRNGVIYSPSIWNPKSSPSYSANFSSSDVFTYKFNVDNVIISQQGESIQVEVGSPGNNPTDVQFSQSISNDRIWQANGTYMSTIFNGTNPSSSFMVTFSIESPTPISTKAPTTTTTSYHPETTTKGSAKFSSFFMIFVIFVNFFAVG